MAVYRLLTVSLRIFDASPLTYLEVHAQNYSMVAGTAWGITYNVTAEVLEKFSNIFPALTPHLDGYCNHRPEEPCRLHRCLPVCAIYLNHHP